MSPLAQIFGWIATFSMICGYLPQAVTTIRTRNTSGLSLMAWALMSLGAVCFIIQGFMTGNYPLACTNIVTGVCSIIVTVIKIYNDYFKKNPDKKSDKEV